MEKAKWHIVVVQLVRAMAVALLGILADEGLLSGLVVDAVQLSVSKLFGS